MKHEEPLLVLDLVLRQGCRTEITVRLPQGVKSAECRQCCLNKKRGYFSIEGEKSAERAKCRGCGKELSLLNSKMQSKPWELIPH